jgi:hypothetical protein
MQSSVLRGRIVEHMLVKFALSNSSVTFVELVVEVVFEVALEVALEVAFEVVLEVSLTDSMVFIKAMKNIYFIFN